MPQLTFMQKMADKASRLLPSSFSEIVEDTTSEVLTSPDYENIMFICDQTNQRPDNAKDVILAIRRRIEHANPKVQYFTVILLDALVKNCYEDLHNELANNLALQNCLIDIAVRTPIRDGEFEAKKAALQLILNMSYWFIGATEDKTKMLSKLADEVRTHTTPLAFEDIEADASFQLKRAPPTRREIRRQHEQQYAANNGGRMPSQTAASQTRGGGGGGRGGRPSHVRIVDAIPVVQYTGEEISGMLDSCMLLSETINAAEEEKRSVIGDEIITSIAVQVRRDHRKLSILLNSGAQMDNLDVLLSVAESQTAIIQRLSALVEQQGQNLRDVANIGADEDEHSAAHLVGSHNNDNNANARQPPQQITRSNPSQPSPIPSPAVPQQQVAEATTYSTTTTTAPRGRGAKPRQGDIDGYEMGVEMNGPNGVVGGSTSVVPKAKADISPGGLSTSGSSSPQTTGSNNAATTAPARRTADGAAKSANEQELDDFFGGGSSSSAPTSAPAPPQGDHNTLYTAPPASVAPNTDFFETNNAPAGVTPQPLGSVNDAPNGGERDEFDDFLNSRLTK